MGYHAPNPELNTLDQVIAHLIWMRERLPQLGEHEIRFDLGGELVALHDIEYVAPTPAGPDDDPEPDEDENKVIMRGEGRY